MTAFPGRPSASVGDGAVRRSNAYAAMRPGERLQRALEICTFCSLLGAAGDGSRSWQ
jgi:hypothetical protein